MFDIIMKELESFCGSMLTTTSGCLPFTLLPVIALSWKEPAQVFWELGALPVTAAGLDCCWGFCFGGSFSRSTCEVGDTYSQEFFNR